MDRLNRIFKSESNKKSTGYHGMWRYPKNPIDCCIYRVPEVLRSVKPEAYTPQLVIIGPLHYSMKLQALDSIHQGIPDTTSMGYVNMEEHKKIYLASFTHSVINGIETINGFRRIIEENETNIRESYSESTAWIESSDFVEMILHDSVFILEFILRSSGGRAKTGDPIIDEWCLRNTIWTDLNLLENQLPYFILERLYNPIFPSARWNNTFRELIINFFGFTGEIRNNSVFKHFTDLLRCVRVETFQAHTHKRIEHMHSAEKLHSRGVKFEVLDNVLSLEVTFVNGCLKLPFLKVTDNSELTLRNIMALEQCHYSYEAHVCNYIRFLDFLIDTDKDVELLVEKGIIQNFVGQPNSIAEMVNNLNLGIIELGSCYYDVMVDVNAYCANPINNESRAILKHVYFGNMWIGTATMAAMLLLLLTLIQAVCSIMQVVQGFSAPAPIPILSFFSKKLIFCL